MKFTSTMKRIAELALRQPLEMRGVDPDSPSGKTMIGNSIRSSEGSAGERGISHRTLLLCFWMACQQLDGADAHVPHPLRIQRRRIKGFRLPEDAVCVSRGTLFGNPFATAAAYERWLSHGTVNREALVTVFSSEQLKAKRKMILDHIQSLSCRRLACWCRLDQPCHGDVLAHLANAPRRHRHAR